MHPGQGQSHSVNESEVQPQFVVVPGLPGFIAGGGRFMARVAGGESNGGAPAGVADPAAGGGEGGQGGGLDGLYDLTEVPEHLRPVVGPLLKKVEGNVTQRFQEHADFRKKWEPFDGIEGLTELQPEQLTELLEFQREILSNPDSFKEWWKGIGEHGGWLQELAGNGEDDDDDDDDVDPGLLELRGQIETLAGAVQQLIEGQQTRDQQDAQTQAKQAIRKELDDLAVEELGEGQKFDELTEESILKLALAYPKDPNAIGKAYKDFLKITGKSQGDLVKTALDQPAGVANAGGAPDTALEPPKTFAEAKERARARSRAAVGST